MGSEPVASAVPAKSPERFFGRQPKRNNPGGVRVFARLAEAGREFLTDATKNRHLRSRGVHCK